jgi:hypothetical protein
VGYTEDHNCAEELINGMTGAAEFDNGIENDDHSNKVVVVI